MNNDYNSSRNLPIGKGISDGLLSVRTILPFCFGYNPRRTSIKLLLFFLMVFGMNYQGFSQAVIINPSSAIAVCENGTPIILFGGPALSGNQKARWTVVSSTGGAIPANILDEPSYEDVTATFRPNLSGVPAGNSITFELKYTLDEDGDFDVNEADTTFATTSITVNAAPTATATASSVDVCENGGNIFLTGSPSVGNGVGEWSGPIGITNTANSNNALFDPRGHDGIVPLIYTFSDGNNCPAKDTVHVLVHNAAIISPAPNLSVCANGDTIDLQGFPFKDTIESLIDTIVAINPSNPALTAGNGVWSGLGIVTPSTIEADSGRAKFVPTGLSGPITLTYTYTAGNGCTESITTRINVFEAPTVDGGTYGPFCESDDPVLLDKGTQVQGGVSMGTWGVLSTGNTAVLIDISPSAGTAKFNPSIALITDTLSYTFIDINGCEVIDTIAPIVVNTDPLASIINPDPSVTTNDTLIMCLKDSIISLVGMPDPSGSGGTGKWTGAGVTDLNNNDNDASFNPELAGNGTHTIIYEYENSNGCSDTTAIFFVVNALPTVSTDKLSYTSCRDGDMETGIDLTGLPTGSSGVWTGKGVIDNGDGTATFEPDSSSVDGLSMVTVQYKYSDVHGCTDSVTAIVTINTPSVNPTADQILCANENLSITYSGTGSFEYKLTGDAIGLSDGTGTTLAGQVTNAGTDTLTAIVEVIPNINGCEGVRDTFEIKVKPLPTVDVRLDTTVCAGSMTNPILFTGADLLPEVTTYSWTNDNINIGLAGSGIGDISAFMATNTSNSMITANIIVTPMAAGCPGEAQSFKINVNPLPTITVPNDISYCEGETTNAITLSGSAGATLSWKLSGDAVGLLFNNMANVPSFLADNTSGTPDTAKVVVTAALNGCEIEATDTLFIGVNPVTDISPLAINPISFDPFCSTNDTIHLNENRTGAKAPDNNTMPLGQLGIWKTPTMGVSDVDPTAGTAVFDPSGLDGAIQLSYTFINEYNCSSEEQLTVTVENANPDPGTYTAVCSEGPKVQLAGVNTLLSTQSGYWTVKDSLGVVIDAVTATSADTLVGKAEFNQSGLRGTYTLIYTIKNLQNGCESKDSTTIDIGSTVVDLGIHTPVCSNDSLQQLVATPMSGATITSGTWGIADTFNNAIVINPITKLTEFTADINPENLDGYYKLFFQYTNTAGCMDVDTLSSFFIVNKAPVITAPLDKEVCQDGAAFDLVGSRSPTDPGELARWGPESIIIDPDVMDSAITINPALFTDDVTLTYTFVDGNGCVGVDSVAITINPLPTVTAGTNLTLDNGVFKVCESNSILDIEATPVPVSGDGTAGMWTATTPLIDTNNNDEKVSFDLNGKSGPYNLIYTYTDAKTCMNSSTVTIDVIPKPVVFAGSDQDICESASAITLTASLPNGISTGTGVWSGSTGLDSNDDTSDNQVSFNPAGLASTTPIRIKYTFTDAVGCTAIDSLEITVKAPPTVDAGTYAAQCQNNAALTLQGTPNPNSLSNVGSSTWTVNGSTITSNSSAGTANLDLTSLTGPITAVYAYTDGDGCIGTDTTIIQIQTVTASSADADGEVCLNDGMVALTGSPIPATGEKGTWTGTGVFDLSDGDAVAVFDPTNPAVTASSVTLTYTYTDANGCMNSADTIITVNALPIVTLGTGFDPVCVTNAPVEISGGPVPSGTATAVWSGSGITNTTDGKAMFDPVGLSDTVKLTFIYSDANSCASSKDTFIVVNGLPILDLGGPYGPICGNADELKLAANTPHDNGQLGIWTGMGAKDTVNTDSIAYFDPTGLTGTIKLTYTYTDSNSCTSSATENIVINTLPTVDAGTDQTVCVDNGPIDLLGSPSPMGGEMGSWTTSSAGLNDITPIDAVAIFNPSIAGIGAHELTYTFTNGTGCVDSMKRTITVIGLPTIDLTSAGITQGEIICEESSIIYLSGSPVPTIAGEGGTWSGAGIIEDNGQNATATFNPTGLNGAVALVYEFVDDTGCSNTDTIDVIVRDFVLDIGTYPAVCESGDSIILTANISPNTFGGTSVWSGLGVVDSSQTDSLAKFSPKGLANGIDLTYAITDSEGCFATLTTTINVESPVANAGIDSTVCINANLVNLLGNPLPGNGETSDWSTLSAGLIDNSNQDANATFNPTLAGIGVHTLFYKFTDAGGCIDSAMMVLTVIDTPTVTLTNVGITHGDTICEESSMIALTGAPIPAANGELGTWSGQGVKNINTSAGTADFDPSGLSGSVTLVYEFLDDTGCGNSDSLTIFVQDYQFAIGNFGSVCASGDSIEIGAGPVILTSGTGLWTGLGIFDADQTDSLAKFSGQGLTGNIALTYTYTDENACVAQEMTTITVESEIITLPPIAPICESSDAIILLGDPVPTAGDTAFWSGPGITDLSNQDAKAALDPNGLAGNTNMYAVYTFKSGNGCISKDSTQITVTSIPLVDAQGTNPTNICADSDSITLQAIPIPSATNESGTWSGVGILDGNTADGTARFSPAGLNGMVELIYTFIDDTGCIGADTLEIAVENLMADAGSDQTICESDGLLELGGNPRPIGDSTGVWSGPGVTDNSNMDSIGMFDPTGLSGAITLYYEVADPDTGCESKDSVVITITSNIVTASASSDTICKEAMPITLTGSPAPGVGETGKWIEDSLWLTDASDGDAVAIFDPSMVTGSYPRSVYALYEYTDAGGCTNIDSTEIVVYELPTVDAGMDMDLCEEDNAITLMGSPTPTVSGSTGTWSGMGISDNGDGSASFDPSGLAPDDYMIIYTYEDRLGCAGMDTAIVSINNTVLDIGTYSSVCINETEIPLSVVTALVGDSSVWSGTGVVDSTTLGKGSFNPSIAGYGVHNLTFHFTNSSGCLSTATTTIEVTQPVIGPFAAACSDDGLITLTGSPLPSTGETGIWEIDGVLQSGDTDGIYELDPSSLSGLIDLKYIFSGNGCLDSVASTIMVNPLPSVDAGGDITICESATPLILSGSSTPTGGKSVWTGDGITDADPTDEFAVFDPSNLSGPERIIYTVTNTNGCVNQDTILINIQNLNVTAGTYGALCESASPITLTGTPIGGTWAGLGVGATNAGTGTATFDPSGRNGDVTVSYTYTSGNCTEIASTTITVFDAEVNTGTYGPLCQNDAPLTITGFPIPSGGAIGTWSGTGLTNIDPSAGTATLNPAAVTGNTSLTYTFITNGCSKSATTNVLVNQSATASITIDQTQICEGGSVQLTATTTNAAGVTWATNGIGSFSPTTGNTTTYTPSGTITGSDRVDEISVIAVASTGNCPVAVASTNLRIVKPATVDLGQDISFCDVTNGTLTPVTLGTGNTVSWSSTNGTFNSSTATSPIYTGNALTTSNRTDVITITVKDAFDACPVVTDVMNITLTTPIKITEGTTGAICEGDTIALVANYTGGTSGFTSQVNGNKGNVIVHGGQIKYVANANDGLTIRKDTVIIINPDLDGAGACVSFRDTMIVDVSPMATVNLVADTTICSGEEINLVAVATGDFAAFSSSLNLSTTVTNYSPTVTGTAVTDKVIYSTQLPGSLCPAAIDSVEVTINRLSTTALSIADATICEVNTVALAAGVTGGIYSWEVLGNAGTLNDNTLENPTYTPNNTSFSGTRMDTLVLDLVSATDRCNTGIDTAIVNVLEVGSFTPVPDTLVCSNNTIALAVPIIGAYDQFTWSSPNGTFSTTTDSNTVYTPSAITTGSRLDTVVTNILFTGGACPSVPDTAIITVLAGVEVTAGVDVTVCNGIGVGLVGTLSGGATTGTWQVVGGFGTFDNAASMNAVYMPNPTGNTARIDVLVLTSNDPDGAGGCVAATDTVLVTVTPSATVSLGQDLTTFAGQPVTLTATASEAVISSQWSSTPGSLSNSGLDQTTFTPLPLGTASSRVDQIVYEGFFTNQNCGSAKDTILVTVNAPQAINKAEEPDFCSSLCLDELTASIDGNTGVAVVLANNINPLDSCGVNAQFGFKFWDPTMSMAEPNTVIDIPNLPNSISFNCKDRGPQAVNVYVSDAEMNTQLCPVIINVMDNSIFCGERTIAGKITNSAGEPEVGFDVFIEEISEVGGINPSVKTDENGAYSITLDTDKEYRIVPRRNIDVAEGVTAFDNVIISRHILGLQPFSSPYQTIAADVNKSGTVTAFDIVIIRKIVLARDGTFDNNTSWRFVDANYQFSSIMDAASAPFQESFTVTKTTGNVLDMDFIAVKIGDVNGANPENAGLIANASSRNDATAITFETTNLAVKKGKTYEVPFRLLNPETVASYQFTLDFNGLALQAIKAGVAAPEHFGTTMKERGLLTTCWSAANPVNTEKEWFTLQFTANKDGRLSELLSINSAVTPIEVYTTDEANIGIELSFVEPVTTTFDLFQNKPNPFKDETVIGFALPIASKAKITVIDMQGRIIHTVEGAYSNGYNEVVIDMTNLPRGVFYYRLETTSGTKVQKMMHIE